MKNALFIGFTLPRDIAIQLYRIDSMPAVQTTKFAWSFVDALRAGFTSVHLLSFSPVQSYPRGRKIIFRSYSFARDGVTGRHVGFVNLLVFKHLTRLFQLFVGVRPDVLAQRPDVVFLHGVHSPVLIFGAYLARKGFCVIPVLTDPPGVIIRLDSAFVRALKRLDRMIVRRLLSEFSGVIALADGIPDRLGIDLPRLVFPGIVGNEIGGRHVAAVLPQPNYPSPQVIYAGTVSASYGLRWLVGAARLLPHVRFSLFGTGDLIEEIKDMNLPNVALHGFVAPEDLMARLTGASLLVNCRPSDDQVAAMSFPSKLIEYALTGVPVLTTRLPSIPSHLREAFLYVAAETDHGFAAAITKALSASPSERQAQGAKARSLVVGAYSAPAIGAAITDFAMNLKRPLP